MKNFIIKLKTFRALELEEIDISGNIKLLELWDKEIPVLLLGEQIIAKHRITEDELEKKLTVLLADEG